MIDLNTAGKLLLNKHLLQVDMSLGVVDQYRMARLFMETGWSIDKPADLPQTFRNDILATNFDEAKKTF